MKSDVLNLATAMKGVPLTNSIVILNSQLLLRISLYVIRWSEFNPSDSG